MAACDTDSNITARRYPLQHATETGRSYRVDTSVENSSVFLGLLDGGKLYIGKGIFLQTMPASQNSRAGSGRVTRAAGPGHCIAHCWHI